jgi:hypothetical protein
VAGWPNIPRSWSSHEIEVLIIRQAATDSFPEVVQVADRWHLRENASAAFLTAMYRSMSAIRKAGVSLILLL